MGYPPQRVACATLVAKEVRRFTRIWVQTILPPVMTMTLYFLIFGQLVGSQLANIHGYTYMQFIVPGLTMMAIINNAYLNVSSSFYSTKFQRSIEEILVAPVSEHTIVCGYALGGILRGLIIGAIVLVVARVMTDVPARHPAYLLSFAVMTATLFSLFGLINGIFARSFDDVSIIPTFVLTPLTYLGGVFYSTEQLTEGWRLVSYCNPILYMTNGFRYGFLGVSDVPLAQAFLVLIVLVVASYLGAWVLIRRGVGLRS